MLKLCTICSMIKIVNAINEELYTIESSIEKTVSTNLKFSKRTNDFLELLLSYKRESIELGSKSKEVNKAIELNQKYQAQTDLESIKDTDLEDTIIVSNIMLDLQKLKLKLMNEAIILIGLEDEYNLGELSLGDIQVIYNLVSNEPNLQIPL